MFNLKSYKICTLFNIPITIEPSGYCMAVMWAAMMSVSFSGYHWAFPLKIIGALLFPILVFSLLTAHEFGHIFAAKKYGIETKSITLFMFGAYASIMDHPKTPKEHFWVGLSGPLVSLFLFIVGSSLSIIFFPSQIAFNDRTFFHELLLISNSLNIMIFVFNMCLIVYPFDGGRVLHSVIWQITGSKHKAHKIMGVIGKSFILFVLFLACISLLTPIPFFGGGFQASFRLLLIAGLTYVMYLAGKREQTIHYL